MPTTKMIASLADMASAHRVLCEMRNLYEGGSVSVINESLRLLELEMATTYGCEMSMRVQVIGEVLQLLQHNRELTADSIARIIRRNYARLDRITTEAEARSEEGRS
jgi:hypothetical protein